MADQTVRRSTRRIASTTPLTQAIPVAPSGSTKQSAKKRAKSNVRVAKAVELPPISSENGAKANIPDPVTPVRGSKKRKLNDTAEQAENKIAAIPFSPTPALVGLMTKQSPKANHAAADNAKPLPKPRAVHPNQSNATLITPRGSRVLAHPLESAPAASPSKPVVDTSNLLRTAVAHLIAVDDQNKLSDLIAAHPCHVFSPEGLAEEVDPFRNLTTGIIAQQVSGSAASSIKAKFIGLFSAPDSTTGRPSTAFPSPQQVAATSIPRLREAGLSQRKAEYIQGLAEKFSSGELTAKMLAEASDEEIMEKLVAVRGLGKWSVQMFACFGLKRMDFFSTGDLGVQRGMAAYVGRDVAKLKSKGAGNKWKYMSEKDMLEISAKFSPYRSLFMWYMWRIEDVDVSAVQDN